MSNEIRVYRFAPNQPGRGGHTTGLNSFLRMEDTRIVSGVRPYRSQWKADTQYSFIINNVFTGRTIRNVVDWYFYAPGETTVSNRFVYGESFLNGGTTPAIALRYQPLVGAPQDVYSETLSGGAFRRTAICPVKDRLFMGSGIGRARVWNGAVSGTVPEQVYKVGVPAPTVAPTIVTDFSYTSGANYYCAANAYTVQYDDTATNENYDGLVANEVVRLTHETLDNPDYVERRVVSRVSGTTYAANPTSGPFAFGDNPTVAGKIDHTAGTATWLVTTHGFPGDGDGVCSGYFGLRLRVASVNYRITNCVNNLDGTTTITTATTSGTGYTDAPFQISGVRVTLDDLVPGESPVTISGSSYTGTLSRPAPGEGYTSWSGAEAPGYAYAYYDPISGHVSNLSPVTYVGSTDVVNGRIRIDKSPNNGYPCANGDTAVSGIPTPTGIQYVGEYNSEEVSRFTDILWFRTRRTGGGAVLYPVGSLDPDATNYHGTAGNPASSGAGGQYWVDTYADSELIVSGRLRAPLMTNYPPRYVATNGDISDLVPHGIVWWDGRVWMYGDPDIGALHYSCDVAQASMGRPEESFPDSNRLVIPAGDTEITSMLTVGEYLLVNTARYSYVVQGNHESNYRLVRVSTELGGVGPDDICEIPIGGEGSGMFAAHTKDQRLLVGSIGGQLDDIGFPIRNALGGTGYGLAYYRASGHPRLALACATRPVGGQSEILVLEYNFDHKVWSRNNPEASSGTTFPVVNFLTTTQRKTGWNSGKDDAFIIIGDTNGDIYIDAATVPRQASNRRIATWSLPPDGPKRRYSFVWSRVVWTSDASMGLMVNPTMNVTVNDDVPNAWVYTYQEPPDPARRLFASSGGLDGYVTEWVCYAAAGTEGGQSLGRRPLGFRLSFDYNEGGAHDHSIAFIEVALREETEDGELEP